MVAEVHVDQRKLAGFCQGAHIRRLAFFGSVLGPDFRPDSDVDVLVEFEPDQEPGFIALARMEEDLSAIIGREVDLLTSDDLSQYFRDRVLAEAQVQYAA